MTGVTTRAPMRRNPWVDAGEAACHRVILNGTIFG
jgi:hypothetical protein